MTPSAEASRSLPHEAVLVGRALFSNAPLYVGAVRNRSNIGDAVLFQAHERLLGPLGYLPMGGKNRLLHMRSLGRTVTPVLLGGGTLIGRPSYRRALEDALRLAPEPRLSVLATGVSAPAPDGKSSLEELRRWIPLLRLMPDVRVRGPRSQQHLADVGIDSSVIGDPVLALLAPLAPRRSGVRQNQRDALVIGVNGAAVPGMAAASKAIWKAVASLAFITGRRVLAVVLAAADYDIVAAEATARLGRDAGIETCVKVLSGASPGTLRTVMMSLDLVVAVRLHVGVIAAAFEVPYLQVSYEDKCVDFQESLGLEDSTISIDSVTSDWLVEGLSALCGVDREKPTAVSVRIDELVASQCKAGRRVRAELNTRRFD